MDFFRRHQRPIARQVLALLSVVWLNLALTPCAMSMALPVDSHADHHMTGSMPAPMADHDMPCSHCPPGQPQGDATLPGPCALEAQVADDSALLNPFLDHHATALAPPPVVVQFMPRPAEQSVERPADNIPLSPGVALHKRFCVYLK